MTRAHKLSQPHETGKPPRPKTVSDILIRQPDLVGGPQEEHPPDMPTREYEEEKEIQKLSDIAKQNKLQGSDE